MAVIAPQSEKKNATQPSAAREPDQTAPMAGFRAVLDSTTALLLAAGFCYVLADFAITPSETGNTFFSDQAGSGSWFILLASVSVLPALRVSWGLRGFPTMEHKKRAAAGRRLYSLGFLGITMSAVVALFGTGVDFLFTCGFSSGVCSGEVGILYQPLSYIIAFLVLIKSGVEMETGMRIKRIPPQNPPLQP